MKQFFEFKGAVTMDFSRQIVLLIVFSNCVAVNIRQLSVPSLVETGAESITLDCDFSVDAASQSGLVVKWFFNGRNLVYQWIPPMRPQVIGILKDKIDKDFRISDKPLELHRAIRILKPSTDLSGNYTCAVSTFMEEDRRTKPMLVYSTGKNFHFAQEKKYVFLVTLMCSAEDLYPRPEMFIMSQGRPLKQAVTEVNMDSWGLYSVRSTAVVHDDDVTGPFERFVCELRLPPANYSVNASTVYYPGLMPTAQVGLAEVAEKSQERHTNRGYTFPATLLKFSTCFMLLLVIN